MAKLGVGVLGYGSMGRTHSFAYKVLPLFDSKIADTRLVSVFGRTENNVKRFAEEYGFDTYSTSWKKVVEDERVAVISICTPPSEHPEPAIEALRNGKNVVCEKPLAASLGEAEKMVKAAEKSGGFSMPMFNYRFRPAIQYAKKLIERGFLGDIYRFLCSWPKTSYVYPKRYSSWKDKLKPSGGGSLLDLGVHSADMARFLVGDVKEVSAATAIYIRERPVKGTEEPEKVETEDTGMVIMKFANGSLGFLEATKVATGQDDVRIEINGSEGSISWNLEDPNVLRTFSVRDQELGWKSIRVSNFYPYVEDVFQSHLAGIHYFLECLEKDEKPKTSFEDGLRAQEIIDAAYRSSREGKWVSLSQ